MLLCTSTGAAVKPTDPFYLSVSWRALRLKALKRDHFRCAKCGGSVAGKGKSRVNHKQPRKLRPDLALSLANLETLCTSCDNKWHQEKGFGPNHDTKGHDLSGIPNDPHHPWRAAMPGGGH